MRKRYTSGRTSRSRWVRPIAPLAVLVLALSLSSCGDRETTLGSEDARIPVGAATPGLSVTVGELLSAPAQYAGKVVTVAAEVNDVLGPRAFTIGGEEFLPPGELLIVSPTGFPLIPDRPENEYLVDDDIVQVTGTMGTFVLAQVSRGIEGGLAGGAYAEWEGKPFILASNLITTPRVRRVDPLNR